MPGKRISDLPAITGANTVNNDQLVLFDTDTGTTKKIARAELAVGIVGDLPYTPSGTISSDKVVDAIDELDSDVVALTSTVGTNTSDITALDGRVTTAEGDITSLDGRVTTAEGDITSLDGRLTTAEGDIVSLDGRVTALESDVSVLDTPGTAGNILTSNGSAWIAGQPVGTDFTLASSGSSTATRSVYMTAGTWQVIFESNAYEEDDVSGYTKTITQDGVVDGTTFTATYFMKKTGGSGHGRFQYAEGRAVGTVTIASGGSKTLSIGAPSSSGGGPATTYQGATLSVEKIS